MRDLQKDLETCEKATPGPWIVDAVVSPSLVCTEFEDEGNMSISECDFGWDSSPDSSQNAQFISESREGWPESINRAIAAEAEVERLNNIMSRVQLKLRRISKLRKLKSDYGEYKHQEEVERLRKKLKETYIACGNSNCDYLDDAVGLCKLERISIDENGMCVSELPIYTD